MEAATMGKVRIIEYEGSDEQILKLLMRGAPSENALSSGPGTSGKQNGTNHSIWEAVAKKFNKHVSDTADRGRVGQKKAMLKWLEQDGAVDLTTLWKASGVKAQHDFGGVGGSLTKNMIKSGGPEEWYRAYRDGKGQWIYKIIDELVGPLKAAFGLG
jgi:hypothetical protein